MSAPRKFDHDEACRRRAEGESNVAIARSFGVNPTSVRKLFMRRDGSDRHFALLAYQREWIRNHRRDLPRADCVRGCGRTVPVYPKGSGICLECRIVEWQEESLARDNHGTEARYVNKGCRCDECKQAASEARRRRKRRAKERTAQAA